MKMQNPLRFPSDFSYIRIGEGSELSEHLLFTLPVRECFCGYTARSDGDSRPTLQGPDAFMGHPFPLRFGVSMSTLRGRWVEGLVNKLN